MRPVRLGAVFGALWLLGSCIPVDSDPPVAGSKLLRDLTGNEIVSMCDWATDLMGGRQSNSGDEDGIYHRCPGDIGVPPDQQELRFVYFDYESCPNNLAATGTDDCTLTVSDFAGWMEAVADTPCEHHYVTTEQCDLVWTGIQEDP
jgi:hypothetical protein